MTFFRWVGLPLATLMSMAALVLAFVWMWIDRPLDLRQPTVEISVASGDSARSIAKSWVDGGVKVNPTWLYQWFRWSGQAKKIRAGTYQATGEVTPRSLLNMMVQGKEVMVSFRIQEGWTFAQMRKALAATEGVLATTSSMSEADLMQLLGAPAGQWAEGRFFPDTYVFSKGSTDLLILQKAYAAMQSQLQQAWSTRAPDHPLKDADELLILASIIEKETGRDQDRGMVSSVFHNRLRIGMPLQTDPTVIYGMGSAFDGNLRKADLRTDTPWNTYMRKGLPPTAISFPGAASLKAAAQPLPSDAFYFVARGDGTSEFSPDLPSHNRAVARFQKRRTTPNP